MSRWRSNEIIQTVDMIQAKVMPLAQLLHPGGPIFAADKLNLLPVGTGFVGNLYTISNVALVGSS